MQGLNFRFRVPVPTEAEIQNAHAPQDPQAPLAVGDEGEDTSRKRARINAIRMRDRIVQLYFA